MSDKEYISFNDESLAFLKAEENKISLEDFNTKDDEYTFGPVERSTYLIECCTSGFFYLTINDRQFRIKEGDCYVLLPGDKVAHTTVKASTRSELTCFAAGIELRRAVQKAGITSESPFAPKDAYKPICTAIRNMISLGDDLSIGADYMRMAEIYRIMSALVQGKNKTESANIINKAIGIIDTNFYNPLTVDDIARKVGLERSYFSVLFREHTGQSPHAYLNSVRVKRACTMMSDTDLPMSEIAIRVGLDSASFSRMFKREIGMSPSRYRKRLI